MTAHAAESVSTHLADRSILATGNPNQMKMSPRSSENPTNNPHPESGSLAPGLRAETRMSALDDLPRGGRLGVQPRPTARVGEARA